MLEGIGDEKVFPDGATVFRENSPGNDVFVIDSGHVRLHRLSMREGKDLDTTIAVLGPGDFMGEMAVFDRGPRSTAATAQGEVRLRAISRKRLLDEMRQDPDIALHFLSEMSERIRLMDSLVENILAREGLDEDLYERLSALRAPAGS